MYKDLLLKTEWQPVEQKKWDMYLTDFKRDVNRFEIFICESSAARCKHGQYLLKFHFIDHSPWFWIRTDSKTYVQLAALDLKDLISIQKLHIVLH